MYVSEKFLSNKNVGIKFSDHDVFLE